MIRTEGLDKVLPDPSIETVEDEITVYYKFYGLEDKEKHGVFAIEISK